MTELPEEVVPTCHLMVSRNGGHQECGGTIVSAAVGRPFSSSSTRIGGPPEPPLFRYAYCESCGVMYVPGASS